MATLISANVKIGLGLPASASYLGGGRGAADTRAVLINGARQAGKSTLVRAITGDRAAEWRDLDLPQDRQSATEDPVGFVSFDELMVIDEIQRAPELLRMYGSSARSNGAPSARR
jgi:hypothetical protein